MHHGGRRWIGLEIGWFDETGLEIELDWTVGDAACTTAAMLDMHARKLAKGYNTCCRWSMSFLSSARSVSFSINRATTHRYIPAIIMSMLTPAFATQTSKPALCTVAAHLLDILGIRITSWCGSIYSTSTTSSRLDGRGCRLGIQRCIQWEVAGALAELGALEAAPTASSVSTGPMTTIQTTST